MKPVSERIADPTPCCICGVMMDGTDIDRQEAILAVGKNFVIAHTKHFFTEEQKQTADYEKNLDKFARAHGQSEGWELHEN